MKVDGLDKVFNLFDTNGRRNDVINAYNLYTNILEQVYKESDSGVWGSYPKETSQFRFYQLAIEKSPEIFKKHPKYDNFIEAMKDPKIKSAFDKGDISYLKKSKSLKQLYKDLDVGIEDRARHYTSNLVKIGLADNKRQISPVGKSWIHGKKLRRSRFENLLPIDDTNLMFLRQLLKLRVYSKDGEKYYSPMLMAIYILLNHQRVSQDLFITLIQMLNPYKPVNPSNFMKDFLDGHSQQLEKEYIPFYSNPNFLKIANESIPMSEQTFNEHFKNRKSTKDIIVYREFYECLIRFNKVRSEENLGKIVELFANNTKKQKINKAFGFGSNVLAFDKRDKTNVQKFMKLNEKVEILNEEDFHEKFYLQFLSSKHHDRIKEYGDVTRRVMKVTGIISFKNNVVELVQRDLWQKFFAKIDLENLIFGDSNAEEYKQYELDITSPFLNNLTIEEIFSYKEKYVDETILEIQNLLNVPNEEAIRQTLFSQTSKAFIHHIEMNYPKEKILEILPLFSDRSNDAKIQKMVAENTDVPTIFEYIVGIAWYHISSKKFDLFSSLNLSMSADFEPETHAGGGAGDIVIDYGDCILMLEVTLMNKQAQKRGEWEPVLRHATNLTIESAPKEVTTLFIADELDENTINIWRAVATVPLQSSKKTGEFAKTVTIMPVKNKELAKMLDNGLKETELLESIKDSFSQLSTDFNTGWRDDILAKIN